MTDTRMPSREGSDSAPLDPLEARIAEWRSYLSRRRAIHSTDVAELEDHLRGQVASLVNGGLSPDEAFLVAVKRLGSLDAISHEFAREHSDRLWKQLVLSSGPAIDGRAATREMWVALALAVAAGAAFKIPELFGIGIGSGVATDEWFYLRNASFFVLPLLAGFFWWKRSLGGGALAKLLGAFAVGALFANAYPFVPLGSTAGLTALHLPMALWLVIGIAYTGGRWGEADRRMDFVRFSGEFFIYFVLIALGGGVLMGMTAFLFQAIGIDLEEWIGTWIVPCGALGAVIVASWLVEAKQGVIENMAPVLTRIFIPLFTLALTVFLTTMVVTGQGIGVEREVLIAFDLLLALVVGLLLYSLSARDPVAAPGFFDLLTVALIGCALVADVVALAAISSRISEFGATPNRLAALGENLILLVNLVWSAGLYVGFLRGARPVEELERWQTGFLNVYAAWATIVVIVFPPLFRWV